MIKRILNIFRYKQLKLKTMIIESGQVNNVAGTAIANCENIEVITGGYIRVGDFVHFSGSVNCLTENFTMPANVIFSIPVPIASSFNDELGTGGTFSDVYGNSGSILPDGIGGLIFQTQVTEYSSNFHFSCIYKITEAQ